MGTKKNSGIIGSKLMETCHVIHGRSNGTEFIQALSKNNPSALPRKMHLSGTIRCDDHACLKLILADIYNVFLMYNCNIENLVINVSDAPNSIDCRFCEHFDDTKETCELAMKKDGQKVFEFGPVAPTDKNILWIDTNEGGGLKAFNETLNAWEHVPAFGVNINDL